MEVEQATTLLTDKDSNLNRPRAKTKPHKQLRYQNIRVATPHRVLLLPRVQVKLYKVRLHGHGLAVQPVRFCMPHRVRVNNSEPEPILLHSMQHNRGGSGKLTTHGNRASKQIVFNKQASKASIQSRAQTHTQSLSLFLFFPPSFLSFFLC